MREHPKLGEESEEEGRNDSRSQFPDSLVLHQAGFFTTKIRLVIATPSVRGGKRLRQTLEVIAQFQGRPPYMYDSKQHTRSQNRGGGGGCNKLKKEQQFRRVSSFFSRLEHPTGLYPPRLRSCAGRPTGSYRREVEVEGRRYLSPTGERFAERTGATGELAVVSVRLPDVRPGMRKCPPRNATMREIAS